MTTPNNNSHTFEMSGYVMHIDGATRETIFRAQLQENINKLSGDLARRVSILTANCHRIVVQGDDVAVHELVLQQRGNATWQHKEITEEAAREVSPSATPSPARQSSVSETLPV